MTVLRGPSQARGPRLELTGPSGLRTAELVRLGVAVTAVMAVANLMQFVLGSLGPLLIDDLDITETAFGLLFTVYYAVAAVFSMLLGNVVGRFGARHGIALLSAGGALGFALAAVAPSYGYLFVGLVTCGMAAAAGNPATNVALVRVTRGRGALVGIKQAGVQAGALVAGGLLSPLALAFGWRTAMLIGCALPAMCLTGLRWVPPSPRTGRAGGSRHSGGGERRFRLLAAYALFMGAGIANTTAYLAIFAHQRLHASPSFAGLLVGVVGFGGVVGRVAWGVLAERAASREHRSGSLLLVMSVMAVVATGLVTVAVAAGTPVLAVAAVLVGLSGAAWNGVVMLIVIDQAPARDTATVSGWVQAAFFVGLCVSPPVFGVVVDHWDRYELGWAWTGACYLAAVLVALRWRATSRTRPA